MARKSHGLEDGQAKGFDHDETDGANIGGVPSGDDSLEYNRRHLGQRS